MYLTFLARDRDRRGTKGTGMKGQGQGHRNIEAGIWTGMKGQGQGHRNTEAVIWTGIGTEGQGQRDRDRGTGTEEH